MGGKIILLYQAAGLPVKRTFTHKPAERGETNHRRVCRDSLEGPANTEALRQSYALCVKCRPR